MRLLGHPRLALDDRLAVDAALDDAFASLRLTTANISAARVRAAVRWSRPEPSRLRGIALLARIGELSTAAVVTAFLFGASVASLSAAPAMPDVSRDPVSAGEWMLNGRAALQRPMDSRATDYRTTVGDMATNAMIIRREASWTDHAEEPSLSNQ